MKSENLQTDTQENIQILGEIYHKFEEQRSLMIYMQKVQEHFGYVPEFSVVYFARKLNVAESHIFGVITFYAQFRTKPVGKNLIKICTGTACHVSGAQLLGEALRNHLRIDATNDTTDDGEFTVQNVACLGCCALAPAVMVNDKVFGKLDSKSVVKVIEEYRGSNDAIA